MPLLVVGSIALDSVETPTDSRDDVLGGSAVYFSYAASYFTPVKLIGTVGADWPSEHTQLLKSRKVNTQGLQIIEGGETFRWRGKYMKNMNDRETLEVHLNVFGEFDPVVPEDFKATQFVFLANGAPEVQMKVLDQVTGPKLVVADTMDLWINHHAEGLNALLKKVDGLMLNDSEAILLTDEPNLVKAAKKILELGPKFVIIKKGEHGAMYCSADEIYTLPAFPTEGVVDPTGAGDSFAGGLMGYLASVGDVNETTLKESMVFGTLVASYNVEDFSLEKMKKIERHDLDQRLATYRKMLSF